MTERKYEIGRWYPWNGGECPVPANTKGYVLRRYDGYNLRDIFIGQLLRATWNDFVVAFCVTEYPPEEKTRTGKCRAYCFDHSAPGFVDYHDSPNTNPGTYTVTTVDGRPTKIVWEVDA